MNDPDGTRADLGAFYFQQTTGFFTQEAIPELEIFPNPASEVVYVRGFYHPNDVVHLYDTTGRLQGVYRVGVYGVTSVDLTELPVGVYWLRVVNDNKVIGQSTLVVH